MLVSGALALALFDATTGAAGAAGFGVSGAGVDAAEGLATLSR